MSDVRDLIIKARAPNGDRDGASATEGDDMGPAELAAEIAWLQNEINSVKSEWQKAELKYKKRLVSLYDKHDELIDKLHELPLREFVKVLKEEK